mmetsp:Transcript_8966/g.23141  ORF Transcript_8966/g.23141 Transcript_8966/m.23141 type:complete len:368 (+) Transcript_8966:1679-2782(+)
MLESGDHDRADNVHHHAGNVRERQVGEHALLLLAHADAVRLQEVQHDPRLEQRVVVRDHHGLRLPGGARGVDERRAVSGIGRRDTLVHLLHRGLVAQVQQLLPADERHGADTGDGHRLVGGRLEAPAHDGLQLLAVLALVQGLDQLVDITLVLDDQHGAAGVHHLVGGRVGRVRGVEARRLAAGEARRERGAHPLRAVEAPDVDRVELLEAEADHAARRLLHLALPLRVGPRGPLLLRQGLRRLAVLVQRRAGPLLLQRGLVSVLLDRQRHHRHQRLRLGHRAGHARLRYPRRHDLVGVTSRPRAGSGVVVVVGRPGLQHGGLLQHLPAAEPGPESPLGLLGAEDPVLGRLLPLGVPGSARVEHPHG